MQPIIPEKLEEVKRNYRIARWLFPLLAIGSPLPLLDLYKKNQILADLPLVEVHISEIRTLCEMYVSSPRDNSITVAAIDCDKRKEWRKTHKINRFGRQVDFRSRMVEYAFYGYSMNGVDYHEALPLMAVSRGEISVGQNYNLHYSEKYKRVFGRTYSIFEYKFPLLMALLGPFLFGGLLFGMRKSIGKYETS